MKKHEWRKKEKLNYLPKEKPTVIDIPEFSFVSISGEGNPNSKFFAECISALYAVSYAIKMNYKKEQDKPQDYIDYTVYPLEGVWDLKEEAKQNYDGNLNKDDLVFDLMIRQPHFVSTEYFERMLEIAKKKVPGPIIDSLNFKKITDGKCIQMLHVGSFDDEPASFEKMELFAKENGLIRSSKKHREIYLSDFRKVPVEKLKTVLRFKIEG